MPTVIESIKIALNDNEGANQASERNATEDSNGSRIDDQTPEEAWKANSS